MANSVVTVSAGADDIQARRREASELMLDFAQRTGLEPEGSPRRYLWTDAFAVANFLGLARLEGERRYVELARKLIHQVHHVLGRYRDDDTQQGWISGLRELEGEAHPTRGGLRIGKPLPELASGEPFDERREWDRDGQYFHYLTRWMHALDLMGRVTKEPLFNVWACELADTAHRAFVSERPGGGNRRMAWKMSTDLSRPLVPTMGSHDPLDGFVTCIELQATAAVLPVAQFRPDLKQAADDFAEMIDPRSLATSDPLGIGGLLVDACRVAELMAIGRLPDDHPLEMLLAASLAGLYDYERTRAWEAPAARRLAFRELGLLLGLHGIRFIERHIEKSTSRSIERPSLRSRLEALHRFVTIGSAIQSFWRDREHRRNDTWQEHKDINEVMLATCLVPDGYLAVPS